MTHLPRRQPFPFRRRYNTVGQPKTDAQQPPNGTSWKISSLWPWFAGAAGIAVLVAYLYSGKKKQSRRQNGRRDSKIKMDFPHQRSRRFYER